MSDEPRNGAWNFQWRPGGWVRARNDTGMTVYFRVEWTGDEGKRRASIRTAIMDSPQPISARTWRNAPFDEIWTFLDPEWSPDICEVLTRPAETGPVTDLAVYFDRTAEEYRNTDAVFITDTVTADTGSFTPVSDPGGRITDEFLENLAAMYRWAVASGKAPAPVIAESAGVPASRVHRWVSQARKRGLLPPAIKGKAG